MKIVDAIHSPLKFNDKIIDKFISSMFKYQ